MWVAVKEALPVAAPGCEAGVTPEVLFLREGLASKAGHWQAAALPHCRDGDLPVPCAPARHAKLMFHRRLRVAEAQA